MNKENNPINQSITDDDIDIIDLSNKIIEATEINETAAIFEVIESTDSVDGNTNAEIIESSESTQNIEMQSAFEGTSEATDPTLKPNNSNKKNYLKFVLVMLVFSFLILILQDSITNMNSKDKTSTTSFIGADNATNITTLETSLNGVEVPTVEALTTENSSENITNDDVFEEITTNFEETTTEKDIEIVKYVFVYGTLMKNQRNHAYMKDSQYIGEGTISGYQMYDLGSYPGVVEETGTVIGEIYQITDETEKKLDRLENEGVLYLKKPVIVTLDNNKTLFAVVYVYNKSIDGKEKIEGKYNR